MKLLHTSDWHLGIALGGRSFLEDQAAFLEQLFTIVQEEQVSLLLLSGDVFDRAVSSAESIALYDRAMTTLCQQLGCRVVIIAGNHDGASRLASCHALLRSSGLYVAGHPQLPLEPLLFEDAAVWTLPYFTMEEARWLFPEQSLSNYGEAMAALLETITPLPGRCNILMAHCFAAGGLTSESDKAAVVGGSTQVPLPLFEKFDYVALGHLHRPQNVGTVARYCGTPLAYSFAEVDQQKSLTLLDTADLSRRERPIRPLHRLRILRGGWEELLGTAQQDPHREDYLKVEMTDCFAGLERLERLRALYPNLLSLTGMALASDAPTSLTPEELDHLAPEDILRQFCREQGGFEPDAEQLRWFEEARRLCEQEGAAE